MSTTLNLADRLLAMGRKLHDLGRTHDAAQILGRLARFGDLPAPVAEEAQARLAEIYLRRKNYRRARRHLAAALVHQPDSARYNYLMATALNGEEKADPEKAAAHYRKSLDCEPDQPRCLGEFGLLALQLGRTEEGLAALRRGAELAPDEPTAVGRLAEGLRQLGRTDEALSVLRAALFRNAGDRRFRTLWNDFQFQQLHDEQQAAREENAAASPEGPVLLPFVRPVGEVKPLHVNGKIIRRDPAAPPAPPHLPRPVRMPHHKRAQ